MVSALDIVASTAEAAFATDGEGRVAAWNSAAERLLGHRAAAVHGLRCHEVLQGTDVFGNAYCCDGCPLTRMARRHRALRPFVLDLATAAGDRVRAEVRVLVIEEPPAGFFLLHLLEPAAGELPAPPRPAPDAPGLTDREAEVLRLLAGGASTRTIAERLFISATTVRNHVQGILSKLGVHSRLAAVAEARRRGIL